MLAVAELAAHIGLQSACRAFALNRGFVYRVRAGIAGARHGVLCVLDSERFADVAPATVFATLLDEGQYVGSIRTMYRLLAAHGQSGERRNQRVKADRFAPKVLRLVGEGQSYREISYRLGISKNTVLDIVKRDRAA